MKHAVVIVLVAAGVAVGCGGRATADNDAAPAAPAVTAETGAPAVAGRQADAPDTAPVDQAAQAGSCGGGPGGSCCGGGGSCSQMEAAADRGGGCPCQRRQRLIEKARARTAAN
jgi:hypothetical protein